jgi:hypothetical protein
LLLIYSAHITPRVEYIFRFVLEKLAGLKIKLTNEGNEYSGYKGPSVNYSKGRIKEKEIFFEPNGLLFQDSITALNAVINREDDNILLYLEGDNISKNVFDPFAASFYLISRYEEYLDFIPDKFNRFEATSSVLYKYGLLEQPLIDQWALSIQNKILSVFPQLSVRKKEFLPLVTIDVDQAYAFKNRGLKKNIISFAKNILSFNQHLFRTQLQLLLKKTKDPYDSFDYLFDAQLKTGISFIYFINIGRYSRFDKNLSPSNKAFKDLLKKIHEYAPIGLHPSYFSNEEVSKFLEEKISIEYILGDKISKSRQHYLKLNFPDTYRNLIKIGIKEDYTMGYASYPGFRAGTCSPFFWFDLKKNVVTDLKVFPTTYMDGSFIEDLQMTPHEAEQKIYSLIETVKKYNGCHTSIWHNHTVSDRLHWKNWRSVFENSLQKLKQQS